MRPIGARFAACGAALAGVLVAGLFLASTAMANSPVNGAAFTTVNESTDGTGHCQNGNPNVNCNIYDGKQFVWMNGGLLAALGDDVGGAELGGQLLTVGIGTARHRRPLLDQVSGDCDGRHGGNVHLVVVRTPALAVSGGWAQVKVPLHRKNILFHRFLYTGPVS